MEKVKRFIVVNETFDKGQDMRARVGVLSRIYVCIYESTNYPHHFKIWTGKGGDGPFGPVDGIWFEYACKHEMKEKTML